MSFFNAIKKSFGFSDDTDDDLLVDSADHNDPELPAAEISQSVQEGGNNVDPQLDAAKIDSIFEHVVTTFNQALPGFLANAVNADIQRKNLYDSLDKSIKDYLATISENTRRQAETRIAAEQISMRAEMETLKNKTKEIEQQRFDIKQQQLSADRQRRALNDRVHDLENQIATMQAEREQFDLENKSLVNKLKVASVHENEAEALRQELNDVRAELLALKNNASATTDSVADEVAAETIAKLREENRLLSDELANAAEKDRISTEMLNGLQSKASAARKELQERDQTITELQERIAEAENVKEDIDRLTKQMAMIDEVIEKRNRKIAKLKETCDSLRDENSSLRDTIAQNLKNYADNEASLNKRIAELEADPTTPIVSDDIADYSPKSEPDTETIAETPKISDGDLAKIEESFDSADWMSTEPPVTPSMRTGISEAEFGYQPPTRKSPRQDNDAQLSLF